MIRENTAAKGFRSLILPALVFMLLAGFISFGLEKAHAIDITIFKFSEDNTTILTAGGKEEVLKLHSGSVSAVANPATWSSSNTSVASISAKNEKQVWIIPKNPGTTVISVRSKDGTKTATCKVTVIGHFKFFDNEITLPVDQVNYTLNLKNDYVPYDNIDENDYFVNWRSSNEEVVSIEDYSNTSVDLRINGSGAATITAEDACENITECDIIVTVSSHNSLKLDTNSVTINYKYDPYYEFDANEPYCYYHNYTICNNGSADCIQPISGRITNVYSKSPSIATIKEVSWYDDTWVIIPKSAGTAQIVCEGESGDNQILKVTVPGNYMNSFIGYYTRCSAPYGEPVSIKAPAGAKVKLSYCGKTYNGTATGSSRTCSFNVPIKKLGTAYNYKVTYGNYTYSRAGKIQGSNSTINTKRIFKSTRKTKLTLTNVHKGDTVYVKAGNKTIKKKIKKNFKKYSYTVKLPAKKTEGKKVKITIKNKFKQTVKAKSYLIWYSTRLHKGMTKKQCKLVPGLGSPDRWYWKGRYLLWCYDSSDNGYAQLMFRNGRLWSWYY